MKIHPSLMNRRKLAAGLALLTVGQTPATAATDLADIPLINSTSVKVLPNIFFILDDSGSMSWSYMPDYVADGSYCRSGLVYNTRTRSWDSSSSCFVRGSPWDDYDYAGDPPAYAAAFNAIYYNPEIVYMPPLNADGTTKKGLGTWLASGKDWTAVPIDGYGIESTGTINLTTQYPERKWCDSSAKTNCRSALNASSSYAYPDATYRYATKVNGAPYYYTVTVEWCTSSALTTCQSRKTSTYSYAKFSGWSRVDIKPATTFPTKAATRTDCAGSTCTYDEEMTNFANWFAWYHTRIQSMKTAMSRAFSGVRGTPNASDADDKNYFHARAGLTTISDTGTTDGDSYLAINDFEGTHKSTFYERLFKAPASGATPLRGALSKAGRLYAGKIGTDPMQYSCQRNYAILSTDGYWNTNAETCKDSRGRNVSCTTTGASPAYSAAKVDGSSWIGDMDGAQSKSKCTADSVIPVCNDSGTCTVDSVVKLATLPECEINHVGNTLADIAYYYYHTDLRPENADGSCIRPFCKDDVPDSGGDVKVSDVANWQHMTTFTIGLGVDGTLAYQDGYKTSTTGDYADIKDPDKTKTWPDPISNTNEERIDDLWHAAVNGRGTYFRATNPKSLSDGLKKALEEMDVKSGAGASAAASNLQLTAGDNYVYIASYRTVWWDGDITAYSITGSDATISTSPTWQAQSKLNDLISGTCGDSDSRTIYTGGSTRKLFTWAELDTTERGYFANNKLSQWSDWTAADQTAAGTNGGEWLVNYLRGHNRYENQERDMSPTSAFQLACAPHRPLYRDRQNILGDFVHAQPIYIGQPRFDYADGSGSYVAFKSATRSARLYAQGNDGMLHGFSAATGVEQWAYVPPFVMKNLYHLAEEDYPTNHRYYLDGPLSTDDIYVDGAWKTILVGALGKGGRGIYAVDVTGTDSTYPKVMWSFTADDEPNLGFTYGAPLITKLRDGTWVVVVASGYNNIPNYPNSGDYPTSDGVGRVFVLRASDGLLLKTISTGVGSASSPSGLGDLNNHVPSRAIDNTTLRVYGGDLLGNLWGFDLDNEVAYKIASLGQPITAAPAISSVDGTPVLFFGTGQYLGQSDLATAQVNTIYGIKDSGPDAATVTKSDLVAQTLRSDYTVTANSVDWNTKAGWYLDLPNGEIVHLPAQIYSGTLLVASDVPTADACSPGGKGALYQLSYRTGSAVGNKTDVKARTEFLSPLVGFSIIKTAGGADSSGEAKYLPVTADGKIQTPGKVQTAGGTGAGAGRRIMWRELID